MSVLKACGRRIIELERRIAELEERFGASAGLLEAVDLLFAQMAGWPDTPYIRDNLASRVALHNLKAELRRARAANRSGK